MDQGFNEQVCYISSNKKVEILCKVRKCEIKTHYITSKTDISTTQNLLEGKYLICLCDVNFLSGTIKISVPTDCYLANVNSSDSIINITIDGKYWYKKLTNHKTYVSQPLVLTYTSVKSKWTFDTTSTCKCMMQKELQVVCELIDNNRKSCNANSEARDRFYETLKSLLFQQHFKNWYKTDVGSLKDRTITWDPDLPEGFTSVLNDSTKCPSYIVEEIMKKHFKNKFSITFSPGIVEYRVNDESLVSIHL